jgi:hypothetical protein
MSTGLDGICNFGLKGSRDTNLFDSWIEQLNKLDPNVIWEYELPEPFIFDPNYPEGDENELPYELTIRGPEMFWFYVMDDVTQIGTNHHLWSLFTQPEEFFPEFIKQVQIAVKAINGKEIIWLSEFGITNYSCYYQTYAWKNTPFEVIKNIIKDAGLSFITYEEIKNIEDDPESNYFLEELPWVVLDQL